MHSILETLTAQHRALEKLATTLASDLRGGNLPEVLTHLQELGAALAAHHALEDGHFFPQLQTLAREGADADARNHAAALLGHRDDSVRQLAGRLSVLPERACTDLAGFRGELRTGLQILSQRLHLEARALAPLCACVHGPVLRSRPDGPRMTEGAGRPAAAVSRG